MIPERKICGRCFIEKDKTEFPFRKKKNGKVEYVWLRLQCKSCMREIAKENYPRKKDAIIKRNKEYTEKNKEKVYQRQLDWRQKNKERQTLYRKDRYIKKGEEIRRKRKVYYTNNREKCIKSVSDYERKNLLKVRQRQRIRHKVRKQEDIHYAMMKRLRGRVFQALKNKRKKSAKTMELVGCSISFLVNHLESKFLKGMNWDNQGDWHIDHIKPCAKFDLTNEDEQKRCFHYSNLQPLWGVDNMKKGAKINYKVI